jgi:hypothetical protein
MSYRKVELVPKTETEVKSERAEVVKNNNKIADKIETIDVSEGETKNTIVNDQKFVYNENFLKIIEDIVMKILNKNKIQFQCVKTNRSNIIKSKKKSNKSIKKKSINSFNKNKIIKSKQIAKKWIYI